MGAGDKSNWAESVEIGFFRLLPVFRSISNNYNHFNALLDLQTPTNWSLRNHLEPNTDHLTDDWL